MDKLKRVLAMIGVVLLVFMYAMTIITAIFASDGSHNWFIGSIMVTVLVPIVLYAINMLASLQKKTEANNRMREQIYMNQIRDALKQKQAQEQTAQANAAAGQTAAQTVQAKAAVQQAAAQTAQVNAAAGQTAAQTAQANVAGQQETQADTAGQEKES